MIFRMPEGRYLVQVFTLNVTLGNILSLKVTYVLLSSIKEELPISF
jgi:hypothetical protein